MARRAAKIALLTIHNGLGPVDLLEPSILPLVTDLAQDRGVQRGSGVLPLGDDQSFPWPSHPVMFAKDLRDSGRSHRRESVRELGVQYNSPQFFRSRESQGHGAMIVGFQSSDFGQKELGELSRSETIEVLRTTDWFPDLARFASVFALQKEGCPPNLNIDFGNRASATILPSGTERFTVLVGLGVGPRWLRRGKDVQIEDVSIEELDAILSDLEQGRYGDVERRYASK